MENEGAAVMTAQISEKERIEIKTSVGKLVPSYSFEEEGRKKDAKMSCYPSGEIRAVPLEKAAYIQTPIGTFSAELVTFYRNGKLRRFFPLDGSINAYWTEADEYGLAGILEIPTALGPLRVKPIYLQFYETGELHSIALWPGENIEVETPAGLIRVRKGLSFHRNGSLYKCEPLKETAIKTPIGEVLAYDPDPEGIFADSDTLAFDSSGEICSVSTVKSSLAVNKGEAGEKIFSPEIIYSYCGESTYSVVPLKIKFEEGVISCITRAGTFILTEDIADIRVQDFVTDKRLTEACCNI